MILDKILEYQQFINENSKILQLPYWHEDNFLQKNDEILNWFCNHGELRIFKSNNNIYCLKLVATKGIILDLGYIYNDMQLPLSDFDIIENIKKLKISSTHDEIFNIVKGISSRNILIVWKKLNTFKYCTNNLLNTPEEVLKQFNNDINYTFSNSKENNKSIIKNTAIITNILNSLCKK